MRHPFIPFCICLCCCWFFVRAVGARETVEARVSHAIDGDSLAVESNGRSFQVRLWGIDAPEWGQPFSREARSLCRDLVEGKTIAVHPKYKDKYNRVVAVVEVDGRVLNEEMVRRGMAWVHIRYCDEEVCSDWRKSEQSARVSGSGLWSDPGRIAPWKWKSRRKHKSSDQTR